MSERYLITCNNTCDLPPSYLEQSELTVVPLGYSIDGKDYDDEQSKLPPAEFYRLMRSGLMTRTNQTNPGQVVEKFEPLLRQGYDLLHIAFSSGLSGTYESTRIAVVELKEKYPERKITVIDSRSASLGEGLLIHYALEMKKQGSSMEEVAEWVENNKFHLCHYFTVDDLNFLFRGGRVSKTAAVMGTMLGIKPVLHMDDSGHLIPMTKVRGRKQSLVKLVDYMGELCKGQKNETVFISHGDCQEDAEFVRDLVKQRFGIQKFVIYYVGPTIGAHSGPGTVALFFLGDKR